MAKVKKFFWKVETLSSKWRKTLRNTLLKRTTETPPALQGSTRASTERVKLTTEPGGGLGCGARLAPAASGKKKKKNKRFIGGKRIVVLKEIPP